MGIKEKSIKFVLFQYLISLGFAMIISIVSSLLIYHSFFMTNLIVPANNIEQIIQNNITELENSQPFDPALLPDNTTYILIDNDAHILLTNMDENAQEEALKYYQREIISTAQSAYQEINHFDGTVIVNYQLLPYYTNEWMADYFPSVHFLFAFIFIVLSTLSVIIVTLFWSKRVANQLKPVMKASNKISQRDLDFDIETSEIKEFNQVLTGLDTMKHSLSQSLQQQWRTNEERKSQISALTHDIKTPIAIIQGNTQLLQETTLTDDQHELVDYILKHSKRLTHYVEALNLANQTESLTDIKLKEVSSHNFVTSMRDVSSQLGQIHEQTMSENIGPLPKTVVVDLALMERAMSNIILNAIQYSDGEIEITIDQNNNHLEIIVTDEGPGFSRADLTKATHQFYRGDESRNSSEHFGMGLFITERIMQLHGGALILSNRKNDIGAEVMLRIPL